MINVYNPYTAIFPVNPASISSVGDQVLSEYVFAFHSRESNSDGFRSVMSEINFDTETNTITLTPKFRACSADGKIFDIDNISKILEKALAGTRHAPYGKIFRSITNDGNHITIRFSRLPINLKYLFTLPDFSIFDDRSVPIKASKNLTTSGPFYIDSVENGNIFLLPNPNYPSSLRSNTLPVTLKSYKAADTLKLTQDAKPETHQLMYFFGHSLTQEGLENLTEKNYKINVSPADWLIYIGMGGEKNLKLRNFVANIVDEIRSNSEVLGMYGQAAFSLVPSDRPFSLSRTEYDANKTPSESIKLEKRLLIGTQINWANSPVVKVLSEKLLKVFPNAEFILYSGSEYEKMIKECDISIRILGISAADPLSHLAFLADTDPQFALIAPPERIAELSVITDPDTFTSSIKALEEEINKQRLLIPVAHYAGVVASAPNFELDRTLAWSWGIQAWTFRIY